MSRHPRRVWAGGAGVRPARNQASALAPMASASFGNMLEGKCTGPFWGPESSRIRSSGVAAQTSVCSSSPPGDSRERPHLGTCAVGKGCTGRGPGFWFCGNSKQTLGGLLSRKVGSETGCRRAHGGDSRNTEKQNLNIFLAFEVLLLWFIVCTNSLSVCNL